MSRRRVMRGAALGVGGLAAAALVGCGDEEEAPAATPGGGATTAPGGATTAPGTDGTAAAGQTGGTLKYASVGDTIGPLDLMAVSSGTPFYHVGPAYSNWMTRSYDADFNLTIEPDIVESWEIADEGQTFVLTLTQGVTFHDRPPTDGRALTTDDLVYTIEREVTGDARPRRSQFESIDSAEPVDDHTLRLNLTAPVADFEQWLADPYHIIMPPEADENNFVLADAVGTGPFIIQSFRDGVGTEMVRNPNYFRQGRPLMDGISTILIPDQDAAIASFRAGNLDISPASAGGYLRPRHVGQVQESVPDAAIIRVPNLNVGHIRFNLEREPFTDVRVRQAIGLLIDDETWMEALFEGEGARTPPVPWGLGAWALAPDELPPRGREEDIQRAAELMAAAGFTSDSPLQAVDWGLGANPSVASTTAQALLDEAGAKINVLFEHRGADAAAWIAGLVDKNFDVSMITGVLGFTEAGTYVETYFWDEGGRGYTKHSDSTLNDMIVQQRTMTDQAERMAVIHDIQRHVLENEYYTMLQSDYIQIATQPYVKGYELDLLHGGNMRNAWQWSLET